MSEPADLGALRSDTAESLPRPTSPIELRETLLQLVASPNLCSREPVTEQYDHYVGGNTVLSQPADTGMVRIDEETGRGIALAVDGNGRYARLDPYTGAQLALAEAYRNVSAGGARPIAVTNCLNFGSPEDPEVMWQFAEAVRGLADGCRVLGTPVTGGNVSFYNQTGTSPIHPTPVVGVLGVIDDVTSRIPMGFVRSDDVILLLGETREELSGSEWAHVVHQHLGGSPPMVDLPAERALSVVMQAGGEAGLLSSAHDLSDGGLAQALVESCLHGNVGARIVLPDASVFDPFVMLFAESSGRMLVSLPVPNVAGFAELCVQFGVPFTLLGAVSREPELVIEGQFTIGLPELATAHNTQPPAFR